MKVLIVDDDQYKRSVLRKKLEDLSFAVVEAEDGNVALVQIKDEKPDLVLMDLSLPHKSGLEVLGASLKKPGETTVPFILLANKGQREEIDWGLALGAKTFVLKDRNLVEGVVRAVESVFGKITTKTHEETDDEKELFQPHALQREKGLFNKIIVVAAVFLIALSSIGFYIGFNVPLKAEYRFFYATVAILLVLTSIMGVIQFRKIAADRKQTEMLLAKAIRRESYLNQKNQELELINDINVKIGFTDNVGQMTQEVSKVLQREISFSTLSVMINGPKPQFITYVAKPVSGRFVSEAEKGMRGTMKTLIGLEIDPKTVEKEVLGAEVDPEGINVPISYMNVPLVIGKSISGVLNVSSTDNSLGAEMVGDLLYDVAKQISLTLSKVKSINS
jgi:twitching motility two-component system response regulator PilH